MSVDKAVMLGDSEREQTPLPGDLAMWFFIAAELLVFGLFFLAYAVARTQNSALFAEGQRHIDQAGGLFNTLLLITASYFVVRALLHLRQDGHRPCLWWLGGALALGAGFVVNKLLGFAAVFGQGITLSTNTFYMFYLSLTGFHFMHVLLGLVILAALWVKVYRRQFGAMNYSGFEAGTSYWHMVDLVWIILFPLVYIIQ